MRPRPTLIPFKAEHALEIDNRDLEKHGIEFARTKEEGGPAWTVMVEDRILACAGFVAPWEGMGIVWVSCSKEIDQYAIWFTRICRRLLREQMDQWNVHRMEAVVLADSERNIRWAEAMGFTCEGGIAHKYTSDQRDCLRYELVR